MVKEANQLPVIHVAIILQTWILLGETLYYWKDANDHIKSLKNLPEASLKISITPFPIKKMHHTICVYVFHNHRVEPNSFPSAPFHPP